ncbi:MAG: amidohydrolase [Actinobacteria bacterium]|nr:amidohydrolase [Actinomycetota bacterium]
MAVPRVISPDDHIQEPAHVWQSRLPENLRSRGPRIERLKGTVALNAGDLGFVETADGHVADVWNYDGKRIPIVRIAAAVGVPRREVDARPVTFDDIRKGCYDPAARLADMDIAGVEASVCYPNMFVRFCGQTFSLGPDKELGLASIQVYNDFVIEEWCAGSAGRLVPMGIVPLWDIDLAVAEARRLADLDFRSITFSEAPHLLGFPSIHSGYWDPLFDTCAATGMVVSLHIGTGGFPMLAADAPGAVPNVMASFNAGYTLTDLLFSGVFARFPTLKTCLAESQLGWVPYVLSRADFVWQEMRGEGFTGVDHDAMPHPPSYYFQNNVWVTFFRDPVGLELLDQIGIDRILYETDYPHTDSAWPSCRDVADDMTKELSEADAAAIVAGNAKELFRIETHA